MSATADLHSIVDEHDHDFVFVIEQDDDDHDRFSHLTGEQFSYVHHEILLRKSHSWCARGQ